MLTVEVNQRQLKEVQRLFRKFPNAAGKIMSRSINRTLEKARKMVVDRLASANPGLKKKNIRKGTNIIRASF